MRSRIKFTGSLVAAVLFACVCCYFGFPKDMSISAVDVTNRSELSGNRLSRYSQISAANTAFHSDEPRQVLIPRIKSITKRPDFGGEACVAMFLQSLGHTVGQDAVLDSAKLNPLLGRGFHTRELVLTANPNTDADYARHIRKLKSRLPNDEFKIVLQKPFVVVGDGGLAQVQRSATATVKWAVDAIKKDFFSKDPKQIIDIWLFKDPDSYKKHNKILFDNVPGTPFGYYSPTHRALVMDISTGGGTLVHEIVHPFMESNFRRCPAWFNEGLASLYEQSSSRNGHIVGLTNWRLRGLQLAIDDDRVPTFKELCSTTRREFYDGKSTNYAQARYLCYYLQENDLLIKFFHSFRDNVEQDPTGYETLQNVLGRTDMDDFQKQWEAYVLKLRF